jgi:hypothetical protein
MGQGSSSSASGGQAYSQRAQLARQLPDQILTFFFSNTDLVDLINLSSLEACSRYIFTTSQSLETLFQKLQVYPQKGKQGEILFTPVTKAIPVPSKAGGDQQAYFERKKERDRMCMEISYYYVRIFQIYSALALTTLNADPLRRSSSVRPLSVGGPRGVPSAPLQSGGKLPLRSADTAFNQFLQRISGSPMLAFQDYLDKKSTRNILTFNLSSLTPKPTYEVYIDFNAVNVSKQEVNFKAVIEGTDIMQEIDVVMAYAGASMNSVELRFDGNVVLTMITRGGPWIPHVENQRVDFADTVDDFIKAKYSVSVNAGKKPTENRNRRAPSAPSAPFPSSSAGIPGVPLGTATASISGYEKYDTIKKLFQDRYNGKDFPKAFCVARAMTLLMPIFEEELTAKTMPYYSQICRNNYDFETTEVQMPKHPKTPAANLYFRSLVALYYDDFRMSNPDKPPEFYQTETGRSELRRDSAILAKLYNIEKDPETFLESSSQFKAFPLCGAAGQQDRLIEINDKTFVANLHRNVVGQMLAFQEEHTKRVNTLLSRMFEIRTKIVNGKKVVESMKLTAEVKNGGRAAIDAIGREARALLKDYYWKSEAYFFKGMLMFMETQGKPNVWRHV